MARRDARLQVPIDQKVLDKLENRADELGFDSVPAMIRFWAAAETSDGLVRMQKNGLNDASTKALRYVELILAQNPTKPINPAAALNHLTRQLLRMRWNRDDKDMSPSLTSDKIFRL